MGEESEIAELRRRISVLEQDAEGERTVSRHTLRKVNDVEGAVLDLTKAVANLTKNVADLAKTVGRVEDHIVVSQAELPRKLAEMVAAVVREELAKRK